MPPSAPASFPHTPGMVIYNLLGNKDAQNSFSFQWLVSARHRWLSLCLPAAPALPACAPPPRGDPQPAAAAAPAGSVALSHHLSVGR